MWMALSFNTETNAVAADFGMVISTSSATMIFCPSAADYEHWGELLRFKRSKESLQNTKTFFNFLKAFHPPMLLAQSLLPA
jgi:hypothetical protein